MHKRSIGLIGLLLLVSYACGLSPVPKLDVGPGDVLDVTDSADTPPNDIGEDAGPDVSDAGGEDAEPDVSDKGGEDAEPDVSDVGGEDAEPDVSDAGGEDAGPDVSDAGGEDIGSDTSDIGDDVGGEDTGPGEAELDLNASTFFVANEAPYAADGMTPVWVVAELVDTNGAAMPGLGVEITDSQETGVIFRQDSLLSDADGRVYGNLISINPNSVDLSATVIIDGVGIEIGDVISLSFEGCTTTADYYRRSLVGPVFTTCNGCHSPYGFAHLEWWAWQIDTRLDDATVQQTLATLIPYASPNGENPPLLVSKPQYDENNPTGSPYHEGGMILQPGSVEVAHLENFAARLQLAEDPCIPESGDFFANISFDSDRQTLTKAAVKLAGRVPTDAEVAELDNPGGLVSAINLIFDDPAFYERLQELYNDLFLTDRVMGNFKLINHLSKGDYPNRYFFRDYGENVVHHNNIVYTCDYPEWQCRGGSCCSHPAGNNPYPDASCTIDGLPYDFCAFGDINGVQSLRREAMALISHVVKNDLSFEEVLTADYTMVNSLTAQMYEIQTAESWEGPLPPGCDEFLGDNLTAYWTSTNSITFDDPCDLYDYKPIQLQMHNGQGVSQNNTYPSAEVPHAGVLSTHTFLNRYMTTSTNLNRLRAKLAYRLFLDIDIEKLVQFTVGQSEWMPDNPTLEGKTCRVCHATMDPMAGGFHKWAPNGQVRKGYEWFVCDNSLPDCTTESDCEAGQICGGGKCVANGSLYDHTLCTRPVGFRGEALPASDSNAPLRWITEKMSNDPRFPYATVKNLFGLLTSQDVLTVPSQITDLDYPAHMTAFLAQEEELARITAVFENANLNLKSAVVEIVLSPYFRAANGTISSDDLVAKTIGQIGGGRLLTPEVLTRKIADRTGFIWQDPGLGRGESLLNVKNGYMLLYGGIDSDTIVNRSRDPFPVATAISRRMANQMSCLTVPQDFAWNELSDRRFFSLMTVDMNPLDATGATGQPINEYEIKATIAGLHKSILDEDYPLDHPEIVRTYNLFTSVWQLGNALLDDGNEGTALKGACKAEKDYVEQVYFFLSSQPNRSAVINDPNYVIRSWMAVFSYLLSDATFLFE